MRKLMTIGILLVATTAISQIAVTNIPTQNVDVQQRINNIIERYRKVEERGTKYDKENPPSQNWGGLVRAGAHLLNSLGDIGDRAALPFLEELAISTNFYDFVRERSTANYVKIATPNESIALAHILLQEDIRKVSSWRRAVSSVFAVEV